MSKQQQQQQKEKYNEQEECLSAQRAAMEAIQVGRATVEQAQMQHEQLDRAETLADETQYKLDKSGRVLRGMETWSGWMANMLTKDIAAPMSSISSRIKGCTSHDSDGDGGTAAAAAGGGADGPKIYANLPEACQSTAQAIQNYHLNVQVLEACQDDEQKETCAIVCQDMYRIATQQLSNLQANHKDIEAYWLPLANDLEHLQKRQLASLSRIRLPENNNQQQQHSSPKQQSSALGTGTATKSTSSSLSSSPSKNDSSSTSKDEVTLRQQDQDEHLDVIAQSLGELGHIAKSLNQSIEQQNETMDTLHDKSDNMLSTAQLITRRADRLIQKKSWTPVPPTFVQYVTIRHLASGKYLAAIKGDLYLMPQINPHTSVFGVWKRQGRIFGLQNKFTDRWAGQSLFGSLVCTSSNFGRREEWEADSDEKDDGNTDGNDEKRWSKTRLLCASAGWGAGGYLTVRVRDSAVLLSGATADDRKNADLWCIQERIE